MWRVGCSTAVACWFASVAAACSGTDPVVAERRISSDAGRPDGFVSPSTLGVDIAREYDILVVQNADARCRVCPTCEVSLGSPRGEACTGAVLDLYPDAKRNMICRLGVEREFGRCVSNAADCPAADACATARATQNANCGAVDAGAASANPPPECAGLL